MSWFLISSSFKPLAHVGKETVSAWTLSIFPFPCDPGSGALLLYSLHISGLRPGFHRGEILFPVSLQQQYRWAQTLSGVTQRSLEVPNLHQCCTFTVLCGNSLPLTDRPPPPHPCWLPSGSSDLQRPQRPTWQPAVGGAFVVLVISREVTSCQRSNMRATRSPGQTSHTTVPPR